MHAKIKLRFIFIMDIIVFSSYLIINHERKMMKLIFIRHAEPDYSIDSLTEKGSMKRSSSLSAQPDGELLISTVHLLGEP